MHTTNDRDSFIAVAPDSTALRGTEPPAAVELSIASRTYRMIHESPYRHTSDDVIFTVHADRNGIPPEERDAARLAFFSKGQPCLRASDLGRRYGWGVHADREGRVALFGVETPEYAAFVSGERTAADGRPVHVKAAMRSTRASPGRSVLVARRPAS
jgi:hypothetical protein